MNVFAQRSNEVKITERAFRLELSLQHRPDAILNLGGLFCAFGVKLQGRKQQSKNECVCTDFCANGVKLQGQ